MIVDTLLNTYRERCAKCKSCFWRKTKRYKKCVNCKWNLNQRDHYRPAEERSQDNV